MEKSLELIVNDSEGEFYKGEVQSILSESSEGCFEILPNHVPVIILLTPTITKFIEKDGKVLKAFTSIGLLKVKNNKVVILCDSCEWPEEIDVERAKRAKKRAEDRLRHKEKIDKKRAELALERALARLKAK
ncbi:ATP synthase epsilon chain [Clostridium acetireducens DSM 10703]|uniref:ATP synthase epsilon chain n=1 Tax=Clostridium acetireducens DSM 10703 TaxID=1121290 RepID=A0A1E8EVY2_9CLOT|nr:F0F1 ATP synthase subunit epsilon [Clostridium acetireducens]OFI01404.1 ATP synthase epsilon chain [Clostridium acetireducens DSM 10703]